MKRDAPVLWLAVYRCPVHPDSVTLTVEGWDDSERPSSRITRVCGGKCCPSQYSETLKAWSLDRLQAESLAGALREAGASVGLPDALERVTRERDDAIARAREYARAIMEVHIARCSVAVDAIRGHAPECQAHEILPRDREQALRDVEACRDALRKAALENQ